jgi:hypothetical protein
MEFMLSHNELVHIQHALKCHVFSVDWWCIGTIISNEFCGYYIVNGCKINYQQLFSNWVKTVMTVTISIHTGQQKSLNYTSYVKNTESDKRIIWLFLTFQRHTFCALVCYCVDICFLVTAPPFFKNLCQSLLSSALNCWHNVPTCREISYSLTWQFYTCTFIFFGLEFCYKHALIVEHLCSGPQWIRWQGWIDGAFKTSFLLILSGSFMLTFFCCHTVCCC